MTSILVLGLVAAIALAGAPAIEPTAAPLSAATDSAPAATGAPAATPTVDATKAPADYGYRFVPYPPMTASPGQPQIYAVYLNAKHLRSHGPILIRVETNENVVKVESKSNGRGGAIPQVAPGVFYAQSILPAIPFIASGMSTDLIFIAHSADGRQVVARVPIELG